MNRIRRIRRVAATLAGLALTWLGLAVAAPAAFAQPIPVGGDSDGATAGSGVFTVTRTVVVGGMPGWQIALIAAGAARVAAAAAVLAYWVLTTRRQAVTATA